MTNEISGGSIFCYLCNKWHGEAEQCPRLPQLYPPKSEEQARKELAEAIREIRRPKVTETHIFALAQIIKSAWGDPTDITTAVWAAGYRRPPQTAEQAALLTIDLIGEYHGSGILTHRWPTTYDAVLSGEF